MYLWRAVDSEGEVLDILVQSRRNKKAALKLMRKLLKKQGYAPNKVVTEAGHHGPSVSSRARLTPSTRDRAHPPPG